MTSNQKKSYQYYFKKLQTPTSTKDLRRPEHLRTQPYVKYDKYEKLKSSSIIPSSTKNIGNQRVNISNQLQKRGGLYSSGYTPGKYGLNRQYYMSGDTQKKYTPKYISAYNGKLNLTPMQQVSEKSRVKQFSPNEQSPKSRNQQNRQEQRQQKQVTSKTNCDVKSTSLQKQQPEQLKQRNQAIEQQTMNFQSVDLGQRNSKIGDFINSTLGKSIGNQYLVESKYQEQGQQELKNSQTRKNDQRSDYLSQIEKFKEKLKKQQMKISTMFTVQDQHQILINNNYNDQRKRTQNIMMTVHHVESRTFLNQSSIMSHKLLPESKSEKNLIQTRSKKDLIQTRSKNNLIQSTSKKDLVECKGCEQLRNKVSQSQKQIQDLYSKRHHSMEQVYKQHKTIKQYHENQNKLKLQIQTKVNEINHKNSRISQLEKTLRTYKQEQQKLTTKMKQIKDEQILKIRVQCQQSVKKQKQTINDYLSCITQLNKKIEQLDEDHQLSMKQQAEKHDKQVEQLKQVHKQLIDRLNQAHYSQIQNIKQIIKDENNKLKQEYENQLNMLKNKHIAEITQLKQNYKKQTNKLTLQITDLNSYKQQVSYLTEIVVKLESQIILQKTLQTNLQQEKTNLQQEKTNLQQEKTNLQQENTNLQQENTNLQQENTNLQQENTNLQQEKTKLNTKIHILEQQTKLHLQKLQQCYKVIAQLQKQNEQHKTIYEDTLKEMSQKLSEKQTLIQQLLSHNQLSMTIRKNKSDQSPQQQWLSISPSTSSIGYNIKVTTTKFSTPTNKQLDKQDKNKEQDKYKQQQQVCKQRQQQQECKLRQQQQECKLRQWQQVCKQRQWQQIEDQDKEFYGQQTLEELRQKYSQLESKYNQLIQQITPNQSNMLTQLNKIDQKQGKSFLQIESLKQKNNNLQLCISEKDNFINESQQIIIQLNDKIIALQKKLYPSDQHIPYPNTQQHDNLLNHNNLILLNQQLQTKQSQIVQLEEQLQQSLQIINLLKNQLTLKSQPINQIQIKQKQTLSNQIKQKINSFFIQVHQEEYQHNQYHQEEHQHNQQNSHQKQYSLKKQNKQKLLKQYFIKIQQFYNEILQIFGLDLIHHQTLQLNTIPSPLSTPRKRNPSVPKFTIDEDQIKQLTQNNDHLKQSLPINTQNLTSFQQQTHQTHQKHKQPQSITPLLTLPLPAPIYQSSNPLYQTFHYLAQNQQQVLRIINQWIRKLQRQSSSIHQYKQKCQFLQQQITHLSEQNNLLSSEKLQIYDKYEAFIVKLQAENNQLEDKSHMMGIKILQLENYVKELEDAINQTNKQCMKNGLVSLELQKQHSSFGKLIYDSLRMFCQQQDSFTKSKLKQNYFDEFYEKYDLQLQRDRKYKQNDKKQEYQSKSINQIEQCRGQQNNGINFRKSETKEEQDLDQTPQNQQDQIIVDKVQTIKNKLQTLNPFTQSQITFQQKNNQLIINS